MRKLASLMLIPVLVSSLFITGCGGGVDETKPIDEVRAEAQDMSAGELESIIAKYQNAIESQKDQVETLGSELRDIPMAQMLGAEATAIKDEVSEIKDSVKALNERMNIYVRELNRKQ